MLRPVLHAGRRGRAGFTAIEVSLIVAVIGVVLAAGLPAFVRAVRVSKVAEAQEELARMHARAALYYATPQPSDGRKRLRCLPEPAGPTPATPAREPHSVTFADPEGPGAASWRAIGYEPRGPIRYRYTLVPTQAGCGVAGALPPGTPLLTLRAEGDLDGDGTFSRFERTAREQDGELVLDELLVVRDRVE